MRGIFVANRGGGITTALKRAHRVYEGTRERAEEGVESARDWMARRPVLAATIGFGLGIVVGFWMRPRSD